MPSKLSTLALAACALLLSSVGTPIIGTGQTQKASVPSQEDRPIDLSANLVEVTVSVIDDTGRPIRGLTEKSFELRDNGARQEISHFTDHLGPLSLGVIFDVAGMADRSVEDLVNSLRRSRLVADQATEISFVALNERASVSMGFVGTVDQILPELRFIDPRGPLSLGDALDQVQAGLRSPRGSNTLVLLITSGSRELGPHRRVANFVESGQAQLYTVFASEDGSQASASQDRSRGYPSWQWWRDYSSDRGERSLNRLALTNLARRSGGRALYARGNFERSQAELFDRIGDEVANQYVIGFYPSTIGAGFHRVAVRLAPSKASKPVSVTHRLGYTVQH